MDETPKELSFAERQKAYRKEQYQKAKERFKNSDYAKQMKEKQKEFRKAAYQKAKERRKQQEEEREFEEGLLGKLRTPANRPAPSDELYQLDDDLIPMEEPFVGDASVTKTPAQRPKLRLIVNSDYPNE